MPPDFALDCDECGFVYDESEHDGAGLEIVAARVRLPRPRRAARPA